MIITLRFTDLIVLLDVCLVVLITRNEFDVVSEIIDATKPIEALRANFHPLCASALGKGIASCNVLNVKNHGK